MKRLVCSVIAGLFISTMSFGCQTPDNLNRIAPDDISSDIIRSASVINFQNIDELTDGKANISGTDSGVIVATLSGGEIDAPDNIQKINLSVSTPTNGIKKTTNIKKPLSLKDTDERDGKTNKDYFSELNLVKNAVKTGSIKHKNKIPLNGISKIGDVRKFKVQNEDTKKLEERSCVLKRIGKNSNFWIDQQDVKDMDDAALDSSLKYWETVAYPVVTTKFGAAPLPPRDIDGESRINIYIGTISKNKGLFGYFNPVDLITDRPESNGTDMLYINSWMFKKGEASDHYAKSTLIHEFQHLVNFNVKVMQRAMNNQEPIFEDRWLNEGLSTYAEQLGGLGLPAGDPFAAVYLSEFFKDPSKFSVVTNDAGLNYGAAYLFVLYLAEQYGDKSLNTLTVSDKAGIDNVQLVTKTPFKKTFTDWATAILLSGTGKNPKYDFKSINLHKNYGKIVLDGINLSNAISEFPNQANLDLNNWSVNYVKLDNLNNKNLNLNIKNAGSATLTSNLVKLN